MIQSIETQRVELDTADGSMHAYVARPQGESLALPGILVFQEAFGVNAHIRDVSERLAALGFVAIAPELFHRTGDGVDVAYGDFAAVKPHRQKSSPEAIAEDARAAFAWLEEHADRSRIASIGFCMGGMAAWVANAHLPLRAAISFYGLGPLELAAQQHGPILMLWGGLDQHLTAVEQRAIADALTAAGKTHEQVVFSQADHAFFCDQRANYNPIAAAQSWALVQAFLRAYGVLA